MALANGSKKASSTEDIGESAKSIGESAKNLMNIIYALESEENMGHLPAGTTSKAKRLTLDLFTQLHNNMHEISNTLQHMLASAGHG